MSETTPVVTPIPFTHMAVSLSGGGYRATAFHLGALSLLDSLKVNVNDMHKKEEDRLFDGHSLLENVKIISTISGGTLTGVMYAYQLAQGNKFEDCYYRLYDLLEEDDLVDTALDNLNNTGKWKNQYKTRNLINAFSEVYDKAFYHGATFETLFNARNSPLTDAIFGTSEFDNGIHFRFQQSLKGRFGNNKILFSKNKTKINAYKAIRLADAAAASSCFPGGFEPMIMPTDFSNGPDSRVEIEWRYGSDVLTTLSKFHTACLEESIKQHKGAELDEMFKHLKAKYDSVREAIYDRFTKELKEDLEEELKFGPNEEYEAIFAVLNFKKGKKTSEEALKEFEAKKLALRQQLMPFFQGFMEERCFRQKLIITKKFSAGESKLVAAKLKADAELSAFRRVLKQEWMETPTTNPAVSKELKEKINRLLADKPTTAIMDGGIIDNQGIEPVRLVANQKFTDKIGRYVEKNEELDFTPIGTYIVSDVSGKEMEPYAVPPLVHSKGKRLFTMERINIAAGVLLATLVGLLFFDLPFWAVIAISSTLTIIALWFIVYLFIRSSLRAQFSATFAGEDLPRILKNLAVLRKTPLYILMHVMKFRASSSLKMISSIFLRRIRSLQVDNLLDNPYWKFRVVENNIYELANSFLRPHIPEKDKPIRDVIAKANRMPTSLWFTQKEKEEDMLNALIACGQLTLCSNLSNYIRELKRRTSKDEDAYPSERLWTDLSQDHRTQISALLKELEAYWKKFATNPNWLIEQYKKDRQSKPGSFKMNRHKGNSSTN